MNLRRRSHRGFSLVEVVLALGVAAFCLVAIFGLLPIGLNSNQTSMEQTVAANLASLVMADLQATPRGPVSAKLVSPRFNVPAPPAAGGASVTTALFLRDDGTAIAAPGTDASPNLSPRYRATITYTVPPANQPYLAVMTRVLITWPALADSLASPPPTNFTGSLEVVSALDRN